VDERSPLANIMPRTPQRTLDQDFLVVESDGITWEDASSNARARVYFQSDSWTLDFSDNSPSLISTLTVDTTGGVLAYDGSQLQLTSPGAELWLGASGGTGTILGSPGVAASGASITVEGGNGAGAGNAGGALTLRGGSANDGPGGAVTLSGRAASGTNRAGGATTVSSGVATGNATGGLLSITSGAGGPTGTGGGITVTTGAGGGTSGASGALQLSTGASTDGNTGSLTLLTATAIGTDRSAGDISITAGNSTGSAEGGDISILCGSADTTGTGGDFFLSGGAGGGTSGGGGSIAIGGGESNGTSSGGGVTISGGAANGSGNAGAVLLSGGGSASGAGADVTLSAGIGVTDDGDVNLRSGPSGVVSIRTSTTFASTQVEHLTFGAQMVAPQDAVPTDVVTLGTLSTNGRHMQFVVYVTATEQGTDANFVSTYIVQSAYRAAATTNLVTAHTSSEQGNGGGSFLADLAFSLVVDGTDVVLSVLNVNSTTDYTLNLAVHWTRQQGGFTS
jgi:hypothetical protein